MKRDTGRLSSETFDVLVIGGGIYGATIAHAATLRGLKVALVEQGDFGQGTSANSLKVIHGGLRYLQHLNLKRMRESIIARRRLLQLAPHLVSPCPFVLPTYGSGMKSRPVMTAAHRTGASDHSLMPWRTAITLFFTYSHRKTPLAACVRSTGWSGAMLSRELTTMWKS